jgi:DNA-directed RNA polymerase subunit RPC12/RpoP
LLEEERWSSEGEEDRAFPTSLRARLKAVFASSLDIVVPMSAMSLEDDRGGDVSARAASLKAPSMEDEGGDVGACAASLKALSMEDKGGDVSACAASLKALSMEEGHRCPRCEHRFALKKTRDLHAKVCRE